MENKNITQNKLAQWQESIGYLDDYVGVPNETHSVIKNDAPVRDIELTRDLQRLAVINRERAELIKRLTT